ncbi:MAG: SUMF1/EgtB/PvdO family nonheme iron enzyme [Chitinophagaceae bacterium]|nr:SUMF1/EgtB/PvdO family nonheme iron enzyme [Chitinophagaceae bacterium]
MRKESGTFGKKDMRYLLATVTIVLCLFCPSIVKASDLSIEGVEWIRDNAYNHYKVKFTLSWNNSWNNTRNHDAAWIFIKYASPSYRQAGYRHAKLRGKGHQLLYNHIGKSPSPSFEVPEDGIGIFIYPSSAYRGNLRWTIELALDTAVLSDMNFNPNERLIDVYGIEMVHIPEGAFTLGDPDTAAYRNYTLYRSDGGGKPAGLWTIASEQEPIHIGAGVNKMFYYSQQAIYQGDQKGIIPAIFPKGYQAFYIMKYETSQGEYADFLNSISNGATHIRANYGGKGYDQNRGTIRMENEKYIAGSPTRPCNYFSWDDACAYADWAGLRPLTELEFEKACRGNSTPILHEYPWNSNNKNKLMRTINAKGDLVWLNGLTEAELTDTSRDQFGASYYWVMDLAGSLWERCITVGDSTGRDFKGTHGDGVLANYGFASNSDWPKGSTETAGFGFRGGGYYEDRMQYGSFNPHSPIAYRNFGAWPGGARSLAYGSRFVRTSK